MKSKLLIFGILILSVVGIILLSGCAEKECEIDADCLAKTCFTVQCADNKCVYSPVTDCCGNEICEVGETYPECAADCPNCDDTNECTKDSYDYHKQKCINTIIPNVICCGNKVCETGETYQNCARDCPNCDDKSICTEDSFDYHQHKCINEPITPCCGNGICDKDAETYSTCPTDCPNCDDNNKLTGDSFNYTTQECEHVVTHYLIDDFEGTLKNWNFLDDRGEPTTPEMVWEKKIEDGNTVLRGTSHYGVAVSVEEWADYIFKFRFKRVKGWLSVGFRINPTESGIQGYHVSLEQAQIELEKGGPSGPQSLKDIQFSFDENWHTFEIRGYSNVLNVYIDDKLLIKYQDTESPILSGRATFRNPEDSESLVDDVEIKVITEKDITYP